MYKPIISVAELVYTFVISSEIGICGLIFVKNEKERSSAVRARTENS